MDIPIILRISSGSLSTPNNPRSSITYATINCEITIRSAAFAGPSVSILLITVHVIPAPITPPRSTYLGSTFDKFPIEECTYGTPYYITLEERDRIFNADLSATPQLAIQRDIFIFQTLIGCRVSDLYRMTKLNVVNEAIEYIPKKTKEGNPVTVRVPLNDKAKEILEHYKEYKGKLLPFISEQKYNDAIKKIFKMAGVDRIVTILDPLTHNEVKRPIYEVASSHLARRTFIGNIYKKVKDPNLVSALSGHKEGSKAFRRYRDIDEEMKKDLVKLLD